MPMPFGLPPPDPAIELFVASRGMTQGLSQSDGPQVIPRAYVRFGEVQVGADVLERDVHDRRVENDHELADQDDEEDEAGPILG